MARMDEFAEALGFASYEDLLEESEVVIREGDVYWYVTQLPDGRWVAWDDAELAVDRVAYFATREAAVQYHLDAYMAQASACGEETISTPKKEGR